MNTQKKPAGQPAHHGNNTTSRKRAAEYVRMSTDHQKYSTENQSETIREYAREHEIEIVRTYSDEGKSGLSIQGRDALKQLISDVESGDANFELILVYDISRWGRFQDSDESAYYEYRCKQAGIQIHYCAEQFSNDGSPITTIVKGVKRAMAGEYSRELSAKVFAGQCRLVEKGFRQGGSAGYGLRRMRIDQDGAPLGILKRGEYKSLQTDRVILVPGPAEETEVVNCIFHWFVEENRYEIDIAHALNQRGIKSDLGRKWTRGTIHEILTNEKYVGNNVYNRRSGKLKKRRVKNSPDMWVRANNAFEAIVDPNIFKQANDIFQQRAKRFSDDEMLSHLQSLYQSHGFLSGIIINETQGMPSSDAYQYRFGSLIRAYELVGFKPLRDYSYIEINRYLREMHAGVVARTIANLENQGAAVSRDPITDLLQINDELTASIVVARCRETEAGSLRWKLRFDTILCPDITVALRMERDNKTVRDYYLLPIFELTSDRLKLAEENGFVLDAYRFEDLQYFFEMAERIRISELAA